MNKRFEKETCMCVVSEQDSHFPGIDYVMLYQGKKNTYFIESLERDFTHYRFKFQRPASQVFERLQCLDSKLCKVILCFCM